MWRNYPDLHGHVPHWRYEVDGRVLLGFLPPSQYVYRLTHYQSIGVPGLSGGEPIKIPQGLSDQQQLQWAETAFLTGALENYVEKY